MKALPNSCASRSDQSRLGSALCCAPDDRFPEDVPQVSGSRNRGTEASHGKALGRFPKSSKLLRHADFQRVYKQGRRQFAAHMTVFYLRRVEAVGGGSGPRIGFTVGRVLGGAVDRNRIKRRLREAVRYNLASLGLPVDVVFNPKKSVLMADFQVLAEEVAHTFQAISERELRQA